MSAEKVQPIFKLRNDVKNNPASAVKQIFLWHQPKTHKICDKKNFFGIKFGDFGEMWWNYTFMAKQRDVASPWRCNFVKITIHRAKQRHVASPDEL